MNKSSYQLSIFGDDSFIQSYRDINGKEELIRSCESGNEFCIRRKLFPNFPDNLRLSRKHVTLLYETVGDQNKYWILDLSSNGTLLNGKRLVKGERNELMDGDELGLLWTQLSGKMVVLFGLKFTTVRPKKEDESTEKRKRIDRDDEPTEKRRRVDRDDEPTEKRRRVNRDDEVIEKKASSRISKWKTNESKVKM